MLYSSSVLFCFLLYLFFLIQVQSSSLCFFRKWTPVSGKATRCTESKPNRQSLIARAQDGTRFTESPDLLDKLSRQIDNYPLHVDIRDKIGAKCSQTVTRKLSKDDVPVDMSKSLDTIHLPHPSQLVKRKRSRKLTDPSMSRTQRKRPPDDLFEYHRLQCKQRLSQFDSTFPPAQTEIDKTSFNNSENPVDDKTTIQSENEGDKSFQLDHEAIWGETDIWIHHRWKYKKHNTSNKPDLAILPSSKGGTLSILPACNEGTMPLTEGNNILKPRNLQHDDWYEQYKMQTMSTFHGLNKRIQEE